MAEILDKLYLELSETTRARNRREKWADNLSRQASRLLEHPTEHNVNHAKILIDNIWKMMDK